MTRQLRETDPDGRIKCPACGEWRHVFEYYTDKSKARGISGYCKECMRERSRQYYHLRSAPTRRNRELEALEELRRQTEEIRRRPPMGPPTDDEIAALVTPRTEE